MRMLRRGMCLVLSAPSGAGKTAIANALLAHDPGLHRSISVTTRPARRGEINGEHYHFVDQETFDAMAADGRLLEWAHVLQRHWYGTPRGPVEQALVAGQDLIFDIDWQGYGQLRRALPGDVVGLFILPPTLAALESRLRARSDDSVEIAHRMALAREEISHWREFDYVLINDSFDNAVSEALCVLRAASLATTRQSGIKSFVNSL